MDRLIYASLAAMRGNLARQATTANNLANVNTTGFRGEMAAQRSLWMEGAGLQGRATVSEEVTAADMTAGTVVATGRELDVAMDGDALLAVQAADGTEAYTRRGDLQLSDSGLLTTGNGRPVLGEGGPITLPPADSIAIGQDGTAQGFGRHRQGPGRRVPRDGRRRAAVRSRRQGDRQEP